MVMLLQTFRLHGFLCCKYFVKFMSCKQEDVSTIHEKKKNEN